MLLCAGQVSSAEFPGAKSAWNGFDRYDFPIDGRKCWVVAPKQAAPGRPWVWRARFFGHEPQADLVLLGKGFHLAYCDVGSMFGNPTAVKHWDAFYKFLVEEHEFSPKPILEGMSRGGLIIYNWAKANPNKVACIYGDAPVCDIKSWPGGKGSGKGGGATWEACIKAYGFSDEAEALARQGMRVLAFARGRDNGSPLAEQLHDLEFAGLVGLVDPIRPAAKQAVARCGEAGIAVKILTGDHPTTALAVAKELGLQGDAITGRQLQELDDDGLKDIAQRGGLPAGDDTDLHGIGG